MKPIPILTFPEHGDVAPVRPEFLWVHPSKLLVDESYQRTLSGNSTRLIRRIVKGWDWRRFKPPVVTASGYGETFAVIDGQHTACAAAALNIEIPVMLVATDGIADQALSFVSHNTERTAVTPLQIHHARVAAGDEEALDVEAVCKRAGVTILRMPTSSYQVGDTMALASVQQLIRRYGVMKARQALEILVRAKMAPLTATMIKALGEVMFSAETAQEIDTERLELFIRAKGSMLLEKDATGIAMLKDVPVWRAMVSVLFKGGKARGGSGANSGG
jgi:hypothetical protein